MSSPPNSRDRRGYSADVEKYRRRGDPSALTAAVQWDMSLPLESGGVVLSRDDSEFVLVPGTSTGWNHSALSNPLLEVTGAAHTSFLRSATGDVYENGEWAQLDPVEVVANPGTAIPERVLGLIGERLNQQVPPLPPYRMQRELLALPIELPDTTNIDHISVAPAGELDAFVPGVLPTSGVLLEIKTPGVYSPFSATFRAEEPVTGYRWDSWVAEFSEDQLTQAGPAGDATYLQLPQGLSPGIKTLAIDITAGLDSPYAKARAIEAHLESQYFYSVGEPGQRLVRPSFGSDPVEWFLFYSRVGGSDSFSTVFVVLARAAGVPARVVSGWAISRHEGTQTVNSDQAHQWAEIALDGLGWVTFNPTPGGAPSRVHLPSSPERSAGDDGGEYDTGGESDEHTVVALQNESSERPATALDVLTESQDPDIRAEVATLPVEVGGDGALERLDRAVFLDPADNVRMASLKAAGILDFDLIVRVLHEHQAPSMRIAAAELLGELGDERALAPLLESLSLDAEGGVRAAAAAALGELRDERAVAPLLESLSLDAEGGVRAAAAAALGELGDERAVAPLLQSLSLDAEGVVRAEVAAALGKLEDPEALALLLDIRSTDESPAVRRAAAIALEQWELGQLTSALLSSGDHATRTAAARVIGEHQDPAAVTSLIEALSDPEGEVREEAGRALKSLGTMTELENGSALLAHAKGVSVVPGTTASQASELPQTPVFRVSGASHTDFLRTAVGDRYIDGGWVADDPLKLEHRSNSPVRYGDWRLQPWQRAALEHSDLITLMPAQESLWAPNGVVPVSTHLETVSVAGVFRPRSMTFISRFPVSLYSWVSTVSEYSEEELSAAGVSRAYGLPPEIVSKRVRDLARKITARHSTPYGKAKAIEQYLKTSYTYRLADPLGGDDPPSGHDPVDWFLFESREGTSGNFSSAFVVLARSAGLPARVVSGWAITPMEGDQTMYADQAHQRAEVALDRPGWVPFDPTPGGAPARSAQYTGPQIPMDQSGQAEIESQVTEISGERRDQSEQAEIESLIAELSSEDPARQEQATAELTARGAEVTRMENGGALVAQGGEALGFVFGTSTQQAEKPPPTPVFFLTGAAHTGYLRIAVGDVYDEGKWHALDTAAIPYEPPRSIPHIVRTEMAGRDGDFGQLDEHRLDPALLARYELSPGVTFTDRFHLSAAPQLGYIPAGVAPTSPFLDRVETAGSYRPFSGTFLLTEPVAGYRWVSQIPQFSQAQMTEATASSDPTYTQLPEGLPARIRELALEITNGHSSPYAKAKALETYLSTRYTYRFADGSGREKPPDGRDPMDWFLFDHREGTCGVFSSAFVVLARSIGIPSRVVSGWAITPMEEGQTIKLDQGHQWAEVAFNGLGWVTFEPTAAGAPSRTEPPPAPIQEPTQPPTPDVPAPPAILDTVTEITLWPTQVRRQAEFTVGGTVRTVTGRPVDGMEVEVFVNDTKEHGGTRIGEAVTRNGAFKVNVRIPAAMERGSYQLIAHAKDNDRYAESWSDPEIGVYSESGFELTGPREVEVGAQAVFHGRITDDTGGGVADLELKATIDGRTLPGQTTGPSGDFSFASTFSEPGDHWAEVEFDARDFLLGNSVRLAFTVVLPTELAIEAPAQVNVGEEFLITGVLRDLRGRPMADEDIAIEVANAAAPSVRTSREGEFEIATSVDGQGQFSILAEFAGEYPVLSSAESAEVVVSHLTALTIDGPRVIELGTEATFKGRIRSDTLSDIGLLELTIIDENGNRLSTVEADEDGSFEYILPSLKETGPHSRTAIFPGKDLLSYSSGSVSFAVVAPTVLNLEGSTAVKAGDPVHVEGSLRHADGRPISGAPIRVGGEEVPLLYTSQDGNFSWEFTPEVEMGNSSPEAGLRVLARFEGTDYLAEALASLSMTVGVPWMDVDPVAPVARGETAELRGAVFIGTRPAGGMVAILGPGLRAESSPAGAFTLPYPVRSDAPLGMTELAVAVPALDIETAVVVEIKSATNLLVAPLENVRPGRIVPLQATLLDDSGTGIAGAALSTSQGSEAITDGLGIALLELAVPDTEGLTAVPVTFTYQGDALHLPLAYFLGVPVTPASFNWLLWVALPALLIATIAAGYGVRRLGTARFQVWARRKELPDTTAIELSPEPEPDAVFEPDTVAGPEPARLEVTFHRPAPDLSDVWGIGEQVPVRIGLFDQDDRGIRQAQIEAVVGTSEAILLTSGDQGECVFVWDTKDLGEFRVFARFPGNDDYLASSGSRSFRVVEFRQEIVRLYNTFGDWAVEHLPGVSGQTSPREVESMLVAAGLRLDQRALDDIISRFEEADYSEHPIARGQYEAMYRSWRAVVEE